MFMQYLTNNLNSVQCFKTLKKKNTASLPYFCVYMYELKNIHVTLCKIYTSKLERIIIFYVMHVYICKDQICHMYDKYLYRNCDRAAGPYPSRGFDISLRRYSINTNAYLIYNKFSVNIVLWAYFEKCNVI